MIFLYARNFLPLNEAENSVNVFVPHELAVQASHQGELTLQARNRLSDRPCLIWS